MGRILSRIAQAINDRIRKNTVSILRGEYKRTAENKYFSIYEPCFGGKKVVAAFENKVALQGLFNGKVIQYYPCVKNPLSKHRIVLKASVFPGLINGSSVLKCMFIPFMRRTSSLSYEKCVRFIIITDKGQIYHNYPARDKEYDGKSQSGDEFRFEESVIWDLPEKKHPSESENCEDFEVYYPNLPKACYENHPLLNTDPNYSDVYGNGGFGSYTIVHEGGKELKAARFYMYSRDVQANPFHFIGGGEPNYKMTLIGTYRSNVTVGVRICIFATTDGGRIWHCKYEFGDKGEYSFRQGDINHWGYNFGNPILHVNYESNNFAGIELKKRTVISPSEKNKSNDRLFSWNEASHVKKIEKTQNGQIKIITESSHGLVTGNIIVLTCKKYEDRFNPIKWALNNEISDSSAGTGILFKVEVIDDKSFLLYEYVSSYTNNLTCRHIHHINRTRDGWIIGTGEIYPNSWLLYIQLKKADTFSVVHSSEEFEIFRLNSSENSIQRTMGCIYIEKDEDVIVYASDHDDLGNPYKVRVPNSNVSFSRNNTGIYKGYLRDIDNRQKFQCILDISEPCFYFQEIGHIWFFCGQRGEMAVSMDAGSNWIMERIHTPIIHYHGFDGKFYYFDSCVIQRKG